MNIVDTSELEKFLEDAEVYFEAEDFEGVVCELSAYYHYRITRSPTDPLNIKAIEIIKKLNASAAGRGYITCGSEWNLTVDEATIVN